MKSKKILIGCFEVPGWGGASTSAYELFSNFYKDGHEVTFVNLISTLHGEYFKTLFDVNLGNPKQLPNVYNYFLTPPDYSYQEKLEEIINKINPDVILAIGWIAAIVMKKASPQKKLIYLTTGSDQVKNYIKFKKLDSYLYLEKFIKKNNYRLSILSKEEREAVVSADFVITHSEMMQDVYKYFYKSMRGKIFSETIWFAEWIYNDAINYKHFSKNFNEREIDVIFIASDWARLEKNYILVKKLVKHFDDLNIYVVGKVPEEVGTATYTGVLTDRNKLFEMLGNTKTVVCPSIFDSAPGILFEASALECNIITSKNCGNWQICNKALLVDPFEKKYFYEKISVSLEKKFEDNVHYFLQSGSYKKLKEAVNLF